TNQTPTRRVKIHQSIGNKNVRFHQTHLPNAPMNRLSFMQPSLITTLPKQITKRNPIWLHTFKTHPRVKPQQVFYFHTNQLTQPTQQHIPDS
ncbi:hypothetical protein VIGAN_01240800, partial [Vigna angularis var. angularis]